MTADLSLDMTVESLNESDANEEKIGEDKNPLLNRSCSEGASASKIEHKSKTSSRTRQLGLVAIFRRKMRTRLVAFRRNANIRRQRLETRKRRQTIRREVIIITLITNSRKNHVSTTQVLPCMN